MGAARKTIPLQNRVSEQIRRIVAQAIRDGGCLSVSASVSQIANANSGRAVSERDIANELIMAAVRAGVPVEFGGRRWQAPKQPTEPLSPA